MDMLGRKVLNGRNTHYLQCKSILMALELIFPKLLYCMPLTIIIGNQDIRTSSVIVFPQYKSIQGLAQLLSARC